jgi:hypothetical protein
MQQSSIPGNTRYLDVLPMDVTEFLAEAQTDIDATRVEQFLSMTPEQQQVVMARGSLSSARDPSAVLVSRMKQAKGTAGAMAFGLGVGKGGSLGKSSVLVRGFDWETSEEQIRDHMSSVGIIQSVHWVDDGSVAVAFSSAEEAKAAVSQMQQTLIDGNTRYIDVIPLDPQEFVADQNIDATRAEQFFAMTPDQQLSIMARGTLATARDPTAVLVQRMKQAKGSAGVTMPFALSGGKGGGLAGSKSVLVRGFDFGTTEEQIREHMSSVGTIEGVHWLDQGSVCVAYSSALEAIAAVELDQTKIEGNTRYIDVHSMDPKVFLAGHNIDMNRIAQFNGLTPEQQLAVMAKGSLSSARDPTAVLVQRMSQVTSGAGKGGAGKGSFGPAKKAGGMGKGPYGGADMAQMKKMMEMMQSFQMIQSFLSGGNSGY